MSHRINFLRLGTRSLNFIRGRGQQGIRSSANCWLLNQTSTTSCLQHAYNRHFSTNAQLLQISETNTQTNTGVHEIPTWKIKHKGKELAVNWGETPLPSMDDTDEIDKRPTLDISYHSLWLRHNCQCATCVQPHSGQKILDLHTVSKAYTIEHVAIKDGKMKVQMAEEIHIVEIPLTQLKQMNYSNENIGNTMHERTPPFFNFDGSGVPSVEYEEVEKTTKGRLRWLQGINTHGLCLLKNVPTERGMVAEAAGKIWPVQRTIYGEVWDVVSTPEPINVAYSDVNLPFHMDLVYYESPPGLQFLHCLRYDACVEGGESMFVDAFAIASELRKQDAQAFNVLTRVPATFQKIHYNRPHPVHMQYQRPHIVTNASGMITNINWAPSFEGPLRVPHEEVDAYYDAYMKFADMINTTQYKTEFRLEAGDMISFNNRRILHARQGFKLNGGERHLQGAYMNIDEFESELNVLSHQLASTEPVKRNFNQNIS